MTEKENKQREPSINQHIISRFPFHGKSKYLIDKFYIIGYNDATLNKCLNKRDKNKIEKIDLDSIDTSAKMRFSSKIYQSKLTQTNPKEMPSPYDFINQFTLKESPSLINEIINDYNKQVLDIDLTIDMIFPNKPIIYSVRDYKKQHSLDRRYTKNVRNNSNYNNVKTEYENDMNYYRNILNNDIKEIINKKKYFMVFSSNPQIDKKNKKSINGFCYINYCKYKEKILINDYLYTYYIPVALCIISEYPYYNSYYKLSEQIFNLFNSKNIEVPIEIMLYNIINSTLSPIKGDVELCIEPVSFNKNNINTNSISSKHVTNSDYSNSETKKKKNDVAVEISSFEIVEKNNYINIKEENTSNSTKELAHIEKKLSDNKSNINESLRKSKLIKESNIKTLLRTKTGNFRESKNLFEQIKFPFLQGYPIFHYNLSKILFNSFSISKIIYIFINSFLEKDIIFFSNDIELLSLVINTFQNLNYPLNDNTYYNINACISYDNFIAGNSKYISTAFNSIKGINSQYKMIYLNDSKFKLKDSLIYDLDNREIIIKNKNDTSFYEYNKKILKLKDDKEYKGSLLFYEIKKLYENLNIVREKYRNIESSNKIDNNLYYNKKLNIEIQESFYRFIVNILVYFYRQLIFNFNFDNKNKDDNKNNENGILIDFNEDYENDSEIKYKNTIDENYFFNELKNTLKFNIFFKNFINNHESLELYEISYLFLDEYISILSNINNINLNNYNLKFFNIFENLYNKKQSQKINIDFNAFLSEYFKKCKNDFDRDIRDFNYNGKNIIKYSEIKENIKYKWYELDNKLLLKYILYIKSLENNEYERMFNLNIILNDNVPKKIKIDDIEDEIEKEIFSNKFNSNNLLINDDDICCMNIILLISISLKFIDIETYISVIIGNLFKEFFLFRKYYYILMDMIYKIINYELNENKNNNKRVDNLMAIYYPCINSFREKNIIPNKKIINTIINMNQIELEIREKNFDILKKEKDEIENYKIDKNNYLIFLNHNFSQHGIINEKNIIKYVNDDDINDENNWKNRLGFIVIIRGGAKQLLIVPKIKFIGKYKKNEKEINNITFITDIYSQRKINDILYKEYQNFFNKNLDINSLNIKNIINSLLNICIFIRNSSKFKNKNEIFEAIKIILLYYINYSIPK